MSGQLHAKATFRMLSWDEKPLGEQLEDRPSVVLAGTSQQFEGEIEGDVGAEYLMVRPDDTFAEIVGMLAVVGSLGGRAGSFALRTSGTFEAGTLKAELRVVPGSGTGELTGLSGSGVYFSDQEAAGTVTLDYRID